MGLFSPLYSVLCFHFLLFHFPSFSYSSSLMPFCNQNQSSALLAFKNSFTLRSSASGECVGYQSSYPKTASWKNGTNCCLWDGVTCDAMTGHIIGLDLSCSWLLGEFHPNSSLFQLTRLQRLNLAHNDFNNSPIFPGFGRLMSLTHLNLSTSVFSGEIPPEISQLSKLISLDLSYIIPDLSEYGYFSRMDSLRLGPSTWKNLILNLTDLKELVLFSINMSSIRPSSLSLLKNFSSSLLTLDLGFSGLEGNLSNDIFCLPNLQEFRLIGDQNLKFQLSLSNCSTSLRYLDLSMNTYSREMLDSTSHLKSLEHLELSYCNLQGLIPSMLWNLTQLTFLSLQSNNLSGEIPSLLSNLQHLTYLDLSNNNFDGKIPNVFNQLNKLEYLSFWSNNIGGQFPSTLFNPPRLSYLDCSWNKLVGPIPQNIIAGSHLITLDLSKNLLSGTILSRFFSLPSLSKLDLSDNQFVGPIPDNITVGSHLITLDISNNLLNGTIPSRFFSFPSLLTLSLHNNRLIGHIGEFSSYSLQSLDLSNNVLEGNIPNSMFDLVNLTDLSLSTNNFSGILDCHKFSSLNHLHSINLSRNHFLSLVSDSNVQHTNYNLAYLDLSACNISNFPKCLVSFQNLQSLDLSNNQIHGVIPKWFTNVGNGTLYYLIFSGNFLTSVEHLSSMTIYTLDLSSNLLQDLPISPLNIRFFSLTKNKLTGNISSKICSTNSLVVLDLSNNNLTGLIPQCLGTIPNLFVLDLSSNKLSGTLPQNFSVENMLNNLNLNGNQLEGPLPPSLAHCQQLEILDLGNNNIKDTFPHWLQTLSKLQVLILRGNKFYGAIIGNIKIKHPFPKLRIFDISNNDFEGLLPAASIKEFKGMVNIDESISGLQYMTNENDSPYVYSLAITMKGHEFVMSKILTAFTTIDLSSNKFGGEIPKVIGELQSLKGLNLSHNIINGSIPKSLGKLVNLEWLDLSWNQLTGEIPTSLTNLNSLSTLNLSKHHLEGIIPQGKQFNTFMNDSYVGNLDLCGFPVSKTCGKNQAAKLPPSSSAFHHGEEYGFTWKAVAQGYGYGIVFGVISGCIIFKTGKPKWLVRIVEDEPKIRVKRTRRSVCANHRTIS